MMGFQEAVVACVRRYFQFSGRARRSEFWWFMLFCGAGGLLASLLSGGEVLFSLITLSPFLAASWRRMHDIGWPGWVVLVILVVSGLPLRLASVSAEAGDVYAFLGLAALGLAIQAVFALPSQEGENRYGPEPQR